MASEERTWRFAAAGLMEVIIPGEVLPCPYKQESTGKEMPLLKRLGSQMGDAGHQVEVAPR